MSGDCNIQILGSKGRLSKGLRKINSRKEKNKNHANKEYKYSRTIKVATFSPTLRNDSEVNFNKEILYYQSLIKNLSDTDHLVFISSQTVELTNSTFYSKAKIEIENLLKNNLINCTILRAGMIFDSEKHCYLLDNMNRASKGHLSFLNDIPKTTICTLNDIYEFLEYIRDNFEENSFNVVNIGLTRFRFSELQDEYLKVPIRLRIVPFLFLRILSLVNTRMHAYVRGRAISSSPSLGWLSSFD